MGKLILAHDLGTSGNKAALYNFQGQLITSYTYPYDTIAPANGYMEQDPGKWWEAVCKSTTLMMEAGAVNPADIACITFSGQMMGCVPVDKAGKHLYHALIWADSRYSSKMAGIEERISMKEVYHITGHRLSASYSAAKLKWLKENVPDVYENTYKMLQAKDYIILKLTGIFATEYSDASGTNLLDIRKKEWSGRMLEAYGISKEKMPDLYRSTDIVGRLKKEPAGLIGLLEGTPVIMGGGDGSCAAVGAGVVSIGDTYNVLGSSSWISNVAKAPIYDEGLRTFNWIALDGTMYTPCGTMQSAGYAFQWIARNLCEYEKECAAAKGRDYNLFLNHLVGQRPAGANNLIFLPYLLGERSPRWNLNARGAFVGLGAIHTKADMIRAVMEGVGYNLKVIMEVLEKERPIEDIIIIGGGAKSNIWLGILADIWQKKLLVPRYVEEATSMGAAICGGVGIGEFDDFKIIQKFNPIEHEIVPNKQNFEIYTKLYTLFNQTYEALEEIYDKLNMLSKKEQ